MTPRVDSPDRHQRRIRAWRRLWLRAPAAFGDLPPPSACDADPATLRRALAASDPARAVAAVGALSAVRDIVRLHRLTDAPRGGVMLSGGTFALVAATTDPPGPAKCEVRDPASDDESASCGIAFLLLVHGVVAERSALSPRLRPSDELAAAATWIRSSGTAEPSARLLAALALWILDSACAGPSSALPRGVVRRRLLEAATLPEGR